METNKASYRKVMGERLREFRSIRNLSMYKVAKTGNIRIDQVRAVEEGDTNYTIDVFLGYILGCELYMYFSAKDPERKQPHDLGDLIKKGAENNPLRH